jgi:hypothetical protein
MHCDHCGLEVPATGPDEFFEREADRGRETRLRQMAKQQGLLLLKAQQWAPDASGWVLYWPDNSGSAQRCWLASPDVGLTLDGVEEFLTYGVTRATIMEYLIRSYGPAFVKELIKHLPQRHPNAANLGPE